MKDENVTIKKSQLDFLLNSVANGNKVESELMSKFDQESKEEEFKNSFSCLSKLESDLQIQIDYKTKMKYSTKREQDYLNLVNQIKKECEQYQSSSFLYACIIKAKNNLLATICQDLIDVIEKKTNLGSFVLRATSKLNLYKTIKDDRK